MKFYKEVFRAFGGREIPGLAKVAKLVAHRGSVASGLKWHCGRVFKRLQEAGESQPCTKASDLYSHAWFLDATERYSDFGAFAWADTENMTVHFWHNPEIVSKTRVVSVLGHELGHLAAELTIPKDAHPDYCGHDRWREEWRADLYGEVATLAFIWAEKIMGK